MFRKILYVFGGLLFVAVIAAAVGLGVWAYRLDAQLTQVQSDYQTLESEYSMLSAEYNDVKAEKAELEEKSSQANADLEEALAEVTKLKSDVEKLQNENNKLRTKMTEVQDKVAMLSDFWFLSDAMFETRVAASEDEQLKELYAELQDTQDWDQFIELMSYMIKSIDEVSSVSWLPIPVVEASA